MLCDFRNEVVVKFVHVFCIAFTESEFCRDVTASVLDIMIPCWGQLGSTKLSCNKAYLQSQSGFTKIQWILRFELNHHLGYETKLSFPTLSFSLVELLKTTQYQNANGVHVGFWIPPGLKMCRTWIIGTLMTFSKPQLHRPNLQLYAGLIAAHLSHVSSCALVIRNHYSWRRSDPSSVRLSLFEFDIENLETNR